MVVEQETAALTSTVTEESGEVPPGPVHWKVKVVFEVREPVRPLPESVPELDQFPLGAVQLVALAEDQVRVGRLSYAVGLGETVSVAVGVAVYNPLKEIVFLEARVRLCDAGVTYPGTLLQVIVYVPGGESEDCDVPDPVIVAGPVMAQDDEMFEATLMVPGLAQEIVIEPGPPSVPV